MENILNTLLPCQSGEIIARQPILQTHLTQLKSLISAPRDIYQELYLATLYRFMEFCQAMPFAVEQPTPFSLLIRQLELAITALQLRRGRMLPTHSESETIAEQEPLWTYALFSSCLFKEILRLQHDRTVTMYRNTSEQLGLWSVAAGNLFEPATYYKITAPAANPMITDSNICLGILIGKIIPSVGLRWLASHPNVYGSWQNAIQENATTFQNILLDLIAQAASAITYPLGSQQVTPPIATQIDSFLKTSEHIPKENILECFINWLTEKIMTDEGKSSSVYLLRLPEGLFVGNDWLQAFCNSHQRYAPVTALLAQLADMGAIKSVNTVKYCSIHFERRDILEGVVIAEAYLNETLKSLPIREDFVPDPTFIGD
ncbi:MAG TPA: TraI domain-containing protein [Gammaproteobacteria bacterium]|nr:TraI domain-containing protein [Gammaproteobacteria bacterium]